MMKSPRSWTQRNHWFMKAMLLLGLAIPALLFRGIFILLFVLNVLWMIGVTIFALHDTYWKWSRRRRIAHMTDEQYKVLERGTVYQLEQTYDQMTEILETHIAIDPDGPIYGPLKRRVTHLQEFLMLMERWRAESLGTSPRDFEEIQQYWIKRDPDWQARIEKKRVRHNQQREDAMRLRDESERIYQQIARQVNAATLQSGTPLDEAQSDAPHTKAAQESNATPHPHTLGSKGKKKVPGGT